MLQRYPPTVRFFANERGWRLSFERHVLFVSLNVAVFAPVRKCQPVCAKNKNVGICLHFQIKSKALIIIILYLLLIGVSHNSFASWSGRDHNWCVIRPQGYLPLSVCGHQTGR